MAGAGSYSRIDWSTILHSEGQGLDAGMYQRNFQLAHNSVSSLLGDAPPRIRRQDWNDTSLLDQDVHMGYIPISPCDVPLMLPVLNVPYVVRDRPIHSAGVVAMRVNPSAEAFYRRFDLPCPSVRVDGSVDVPLVRPPTFAADPAPGHRMPMAIPIFDTTTGRGLVGFNGRTVYVPNPASLFMVPAQGKLPQPSESLEDDRFPAAVRGARRRPPDFLHEPADEGVARVVPPRTATRPEAAAVAAPPLFKRPEVQAPVKQEVQATPFVPTMRFVNMPAEGGRAKFEYLTDVIRFFRIYLEIPKRPPPKKKRVPRPKGQYERLDTLSDSEFTWETQQLTNVNQRQQMTTKLKFMTEVLHKATSKSLSLSVTARMTKVKVKKFRRPKWIRHVTKTKPAQPSVRLAVEVPQRKHDRWKTEPTLKGAIQGERKGPKSEQLQGKPRFIEPPTKNLPAPRRLARKESTNVLTLPDPEVEGELEQESPKSPKKIGKKVIRKKIKNYKYQVQRPSHRLRRWAQHVLWPKEEPQRRERAAFFDRGQKGPLKKVKAPEQVIVVVPPTSADTDAHIERPKLSPRIRGRYGFPRLDLPERVLWSDSHYSLPTHSSTTAVESSDTWTTPPPRSTVPSSSTSASMTEYDDYHVQFEDEFETYYDSEESTPLEVARQAGYVARTASLWSRDRIRHRQHWKTGGRSIANNALPLHKVRSVRFAKPTVEWRWFKDDSVGCWGRHQVPTLTLLDELGFDVSTIPLQIDIQEYTRLAHTALAGHPETAGAHPAWLSFWEVARQPPVNYNKFDYNIWDKRAEPLPRLPPLPKRPPGTGVKMLRRTQPLQSIQKVIDLGFPYYVPPELAPETAMKRPMRPQVMSYNVAMGLRPGLTRDA
ncbi:MAG: uncharacterized protein KVP18_002067 [Porospora cf. gigantea A]|uniref:uncharacterized protein n=1 Tax=Porospora cf. gigantea A TaxID=2853593 RepID=UPI003559B143|nr:MAG: hypothetical protein KVP18_002067 [Porospora cf. gigantea A]